MVIHFELFPMLLSWAGVGFGVAAAYFVFRKRYVRKDAKRGKR